MAWAAITDADFLLEGFNSTENDTLTGVSISSGLTQILSAAVGQWRGVIEAADNELDPDTTKVPASVRPYVIAHARWRLLVKFPQLRQLQTEERKDEAEKAEEVLREIAKGEFPIEPPEEDEDISGGGNWGSETKIQMRTHITPSE